MSEVPAGGKVPSFEVTQVDQKIMVRDRFFGVFEGNRLAEVNIAEGPSCWTSYELVTTDGEHFAVLATRHGPLGTELLDSWPLPPWREFPWELLPGCRNAGEAKAWLGVHFPPPPSHDPAWRFRDEEDPEEPYVTEDGNEYGEYRTVTEIAARTVPVAELPDDADVVFDYLAQGLAGRLPPLDLAGYELREVATWGFTLYDPAGLDVDGGRGWRAVASVWWAGRQALLAGEWTEGDATSRGAGEMTFTLHAPMTHDRAAEVALGKAHSGAPLPSLEWLYREVKP